MGASTDAGAPPRFPIPAHQTGRAQLRHPAFRLAFIADSRTTVHLGSAEPQYHNSPKTATMLKRLVPLMQARRLRRSSNALINVAVNRIVRRYSGFRS